MNATPPRDDEVSEPAIAADFPAEGDAPSDAPSESPTVAPSVAPAAAQAPAAAADLSPAECAAQLRQRFPALFGRNPKPLKLRIQADIQQRAPGVFSKRALSAYLHRLTGSHGYLVALTQASHRHDLDGAPHEPLSDEHRQAAAAELQRRRGNQEARAAQEAQERRNRATLLRDFERTTLTPANFCALKGLSLEELDGLLAIARREAAEAPLLPPPDPRAQRPAGGGPGHAPGRGRGPHGGPHDAPRGGPNARPNGGRPAGPRRGPDGAPRPPRPPRPPRNPADS